MTLPLPVPEPVVMRVCSVCREPWTRHESTARARWWAEQDDDVPEPAPAELAVDLRDCVAALQVANAGPPGPQGPTGPQGISG